MLDTIVATFVMVDCVNGRDVNVCVSADRCQRYWIVWAGDSEATREPECNRTYSDRESAVLAAEALAMRLHQGGEHATAAEYNSATELEG